jgi:hypothetical protein
MKIFALVILSFITSCASKSLIKKEMYSCDTREFGYSHVEFILNSKDSTFFASYEYRISLKKGKEKIYGEYKIINNLIVFKSKNFKEIINPFLKCNSYIKGQENVQCIDTLVYSIDSIYTLSDIPNERYILHKAKK